MELWNQQAPLLVLGKLPVRIVFLDETAVKELDRPELFLSSIGTWNQLGTQAPKANRVLRCDITYGGISTEEVSVFSLPRHRELDSSTSQLTASHMYKQRCKR
jgi:hypothetical protein